MKPFLRYFSDHEFIRNDVQWLPMIAPDHLVKLDILRYHLGKPIYISGHPRALGRKDGDSTSLHNIERYGEVLATDVQADGLDTWNSANEFYMLSVDMGFTEIGFYPHWEPMPGFHLGSRRDREMGNPATFGYILRDGELIEVSIGDAMDVLEIMA